MKTKSKLLILASLIAVASLATIISYKAGLKKATLVKEEQIASLKESHKKEQEASQRRQEAKDALLSNVRGELEDIQGELQQEKAKSKELERKLKEAKAKAKNKPQKATRGGVKRKQAQTSRDKGKYIGVFEATAYDDSPQSQEKWVGQTATGVKPQVGVIAVDPRIIPLGTKLYVEGYGECIAGDTGGAIKGRRLDLFFNTRSEVKKYGRKNVKVYRRD